MPSTDFKYVYFHLETGNVKKYAGLIFALCTAFILPSAFAQDSKNTGITSCTFDDGREMSVRYNPTEQKKGEEIPNGKPWTPDGVQMLLFTPADLEAGNATIPTGAYGMYVLRNKNDWTLIISHNIREGSPYDPAQDVARVTMGTGKVSSPRTALSVSLGHMSPKVCSIQVAFGDTGAFADFKQK